jgi:mono/diheme cytochrome c family protein
VWLFSLAGKIESLPTAAPPVAGLAAVEAVANGTVAAGAAAAPAFPPMPAGEPNVTAGKDLYERFCVACHGDTGLGGHGGGASLLTIATTPNNVPAIYATANTGKNQNMPPFKGALKPEEIRDIAGYISKALIPGQHQ